MWIITGIVSLGVHPPSDSLAMLAEVGLTGPVALGALIAASLWDLGLGVALLIGWRVPLIGWLQIATMVVFTLVIAIGLPEWLTHPFGPVLRSAHSRQHPVDDQGGGAPPWMNFQGRSSTPSAWIT